MPTLIRLAPEADDLALVDSIAAVLAKEMPLTHLAAAPLALSGAVWSAAVDLGWVLAGLDEDKGGAGFDVAQETLVNQTYGRAVAPAALLSSALHARAVAHLGGAPDGAARCGFAATVGDTAYTPGQAVTVQLVDADADHFILLGAAGAALIDRAHLGEIAPTESLDPTIALARAIVTGTPAWLPADVEDLVLRAQLLMAAQLTGSALASTEMAADYAKVRVQFGKPIGAYQAVAHLCAEAIVHARASAAQVALASLALREGWPDVAVQIASAARLAMDAALRAGTTNIQVHGAMGYSAESGAHLFLKRAALWRRLMPGKAQLQARLLALA